MASDLVPLLPAGLQSSLDRLRQLNTQNIQTQWRQHSETPENALTPIDLFASEIASRWPLVSLNDRQHIAWDKGLQIIWLYQSIAVPAHLQGYPLTGLMLRLSLTWWAEDAQIYVDGALVQSGDLFECFTRLCLSESVQTGQTFQVAIRLISPNHDHGALVQSHLTYELPPQHPTPEPSFIADELTVLATLEPASQPEIIAAIAHLPWATLSPSPLSSHSHQTALDLWHTLSAQASIPATVHPFQQALSNLRRELKHYSPKLKARQIQCVGHAHLDMAWLWPISDTWEAAERTFRSILDLQADFSELTYTHSSPALFEWLERSRPELFAQIQKKVKEGSWSIDAGLWIEPELNLVSGESIVRQILYGQRYCQEKFGQMSKIAWLPDSFGFCWQLPQLLTQGGIETFATLKLSWNDTSDFPHSLFWWQSPDGSRILSLMLPPIGTDIDPVKMSTHARNWEDHTGITDTLWLPGLGDHGGGPTRDMLEKARRWQKSPFFPELNFTTPNQYIKSLPPSTRLSNSIPVDRISSQDSLPIWKSDLYLELHRGCYTTHADQKQSNRQSEDLLYQAEVFATIAKIKANHSYPKADLEAAWKLLLFNQFHDILPGTSIPEVFEEANNGWQQVQQIGQSVLDESLKAIASTIQFPYPPHPEAKPILVFNPHTWPQNAVVSFEVSQLDPEKTHRHWIIYSPDYEVIPNQNAPKLSNKRASRQVRFLASQVPPLGYQCYWIRPTNKPNDLLRDAPGLAEYILENEFLKVSIDPLTGQINHLIEKSTQTEIFSSSGNQLQMFRDQSGYWDAWNIAPDYEEHPLPSPELFSIQWQETGPIRQCIRVTYKTKASFIAQDYILDAATPFLAVSNRIIWEETQVLLKVNFPLTVSSDVATYEIPFGAITRKTVPKTPAEKAQWETPALRWANIGDQNFGISILTTCKHGFDVSSSRIRLTLLKSALWPDPTADRGTHRFTYAIYPHAKTWQQTRTVQHARALSMPPIVYQPEASTAYTKAKDSNQHSFLTIRNPNVIMSAFKPTEDNPNEFILRCYEALGVSTHLEVTQSLELSTALKRVNRANLLETTVQHQHPMQVEPWQIATYRLKRKT